MNNDRIINSIMVEEFLSYQGYNQCALYAISDGHPTILLAVVPGTELDLLNPIMMMVGESLKTIRRMLFENGAIYVNFDDDVIKGGSV